MYFEDSELGTLQLKATALGERIDVRAWSLQLKMLSAPSMFQWGEKSMVILFRYGVVVTVNITPTEEDLLYNQSQAYLDDIAPRPEKEEIRVRKITDTSEGFREGEVLLTQFTYEKIQLVAEILARSVALARFENQVKNSFASIEPFARSLQENGREDGHEKQLLQNLGEALLILHNTAHRLEIDDKPDILWDRTDMERLYLRLEDEYELRERAKTLERKLELIATTAETVLNIVNNKRSHQLESYIIILIVVEIIIGLVFHFTGTS